MNRAVRFFACWTLTAAITLGFAGCAGYQMGPVKPTGYQGINKLYVPTFANDTLEPRAATIVTNSVIKHLQQDGTYQITTKENADAILTGTIRQIERRQLRGAQLNTLRTTEMEIYMIVEWSLVNPKTGEKFAYAEAKDPRGTRIGEETKLRDRPGRVRGQTIQFLDPNFQLSERNALPLAADDAARQLVGHLANGW